MNTQKFLLAAIFSIGAAAFVAAQDPTPAAPPAGAPGAPARGGARGARPPQPPDMSTPDPIARPANGKALITEDFESAQLDAKKWTLHVTGDQTLALTKEKVAHGQQALKVVLPAGKAGAPTWAMIGTMLPASLKDHYYGRAYMYISGPAQAHNVYMNTGSTGFPISDFLEIGYNGGNFMTSYQQNAPADGHPRSEVTSRQGLVPFGKWFCLEWEMINKPEDRIVLWVDGQLVSNKAWTFNPVSRDPDPALKVSSGLVPTGFVEYNVGYRAWSGAGSNAEDIVVYYDDIALGDKPIGQLAPVK